MNTILIHSVPRSGSSWLLSLFNSHPNIKALYQPLFSYAFKNIINENSTKEEYDNFIKKLIETNDDFCCMKSNFHTKGNITEYNIGNKGKLKYLCLKHVTHHYNITKFIKHNPDVKIIGLIRNPCSVIYSQMNAEKELLKDWLNGSDKNLGLKENFFGFNKWKELNSIFYNLKREFPSNIIIINYEELVNNTELTIKTIFDFCNIDFLPEVSEFIKITKSENSDYDYSIFKNEDTINKYKDKLSSEIVEYIINNS